ncbi:MAG: hypothetical protein WBA31_01255 [Candidatus Dormiibacterota bacterium]
MPDLSLPGATQLRALDGLASDARSLLRRSTRLERQTADLSDTDLTGQARDLVAAAEHLLASFEEKRRDSRLLARQHLRGTEVDAEHP